jgi:TRAP-type C4-dicarboxylate transport system permease small subunit
VATESVVIAPAWGFRHQSDAGRLLARLAVATEWLSGAVLAIDVLLVFLSVIYRYLLHDPVDWAEEIARALMIVLVFFGAATVLARSQHVGVDVFRKLLPERWQPVLIQLSHWVIAAVSASLAVSSLLLLMDSWTQRTSLGLPQWIYVFPVLIGSSFMALFGVANALQGPRRAVIASLLGSVGLGLAICAWNLAAPQHPVPHGLLLALAFFGGLLLGVPIGFVLAFASLVYFLSDPSLPILVYSQQVMAGSDHFVLLAIPFFVLAGLLMESNGMSSRLIELLLRVFGRLRGGNVGIIDCIAGVGEQNIRSRRLGLRIPARTEPPPAAICVNEIHSISASLPGSDTATWANEPPEFLRKSGAVNCAM